MTKYKQVQVHTPVKRKLEEAKKELNLKSESETIAYLAILREMYREKITLVQHQEIQKRVDETLSQATI